ncbi:hypothetical protein TBLA_0J00900 [Henningerozyma blattae CBS 6284]|uniref:Uncharacterized protein n=1 Tax=Henningerozyma blattae (strain ATCC 34711 / CBS 6284 / DSM 70876 / NBRC 10599 / NRRL Y-10934 / UCD 77-7) TaxID=1071380 RepID=I2H9N6_HENB6|nr:hypothetical protein TBLA_0J00900 [Tetrapisispora blattae CBS 6284]CCH63088.1 hypothetical protein TBLA_0J00900 [Tetrapisispora blattae CBS 6284]
MRAPQPHSHFRDSCTRHHHRSTDTKMSGNDYTFFSATNVPLADWAINCQRAELLLQRLPGSLHPSDSKDNTHVSDDMNSTSSAVALIPALLAGSDIYKECTSISHDYRLTVAQYSFIRSLAINADTKHIVDNYLLNLAIENQCNLNYKKRCLEFANWKLLHCNYMGKLTRQEKAIVWSHCQSELYQLLGLNWTPDDPNTLNF